MPFYILPMGQAVTLRQVVRMKAKSETNTKPETHIKSEMQLRHPVFGGDLFSN